jgi:hypothetical protein
MMSPAERTRLIEDFIGYYAKQPADPSAPQDMDIPEFWAIEALDEAVHNNPELAWSVILELAGLVKSQTAIGCLAAGPLEDIIRYHGVEFVDRIEIEAKRNASFRYLLGGVWPSEDPDVWSRVEAVRVESW